MVKRLDGVKSKGKLIKHINELYLHVCEYCKYYKYFIPYDIKDIVNAVNEGKSPEELKDLIR